MSQSNLPMLHTLSALPKHDKTMWIASVVSVLVHMGLIFGIGFAAPTLLDQMAQEVATVATDNLDENKDANFVANASQEGGGQVRQLLRLETKYISPDDDVQMQETQDVINLQRQIRQQNYQASYLRTTLSIRHSQNSNDNSSKKDQDDLQAQEERLRKKIATLEAQLSQREQSFATISKTQTVDSNATTHGKAAAYLENFRVHVERVANQYYPEVARAQNMTGDVRLMVVVAPTGQLKAIHLLESSGSAILDEAAKQSVRQSAPFGRFSADMQEDITELRIVRTWRYSDKIEVDF